jgi:predicted acetyltransferase
MIFSEGLCPKENIITEGNIAESPERRVYKWYIIPKVKELTKFRINFKPCWLLTMRIQFLISYVYQSFWRFLFKMFEYVSTILWIIKGNIRLENLCLNQIFWTKLQTTARERHIVSEHGVHTSCVSVGYYNIPRWICRGIL